MGKVFIGCPVSGWGLGGRSGAPSPSINMEGLRKLVQILDGSQPHFSRWRISTQSTLPPTPPLRAQPEAGGLHSVNVKVLFSAGLQYTKATHGLLLQAGLGLCRWWVCVQGCNPAFRTGQVSEGNGSPGSPQIPVAPGVPRSLAHGCFHRVCFCSVFCSINRRGQWGH